PLRRGRVAFCALRPQVPPLEARHVAIACGLVLGAIATASFLLVRSITSPLSRLARATRSFGAGDLGARAPEDRRDEIGDVARAFNEMAARIEALRRSEKELLANVSHELRTPLARIRVVVELAEDEEPKAARAYLQEIVEDLTEIERMIDDIIAVARLDSAEASAGPAYPALRFEPTHVGELLRAVVQRLGTTPAGVALEIDAAAPTTIECDATLVRRVVANLLQNAAFHGGGSAIEVHVGSAKDGVEIVVRDHGAGIPAADVARVFDAFFRADASRTRSTGGVGLGLTLSKRIVDAHGGSIALASELGRGTEVRVILPRRAHKISAAAPRGR
ncbi:MAG: HAMP domain-containing sensor histidine kinase, partial [Byssovorax sp.]